MTTTITTEQVKELRDKTSVSVMQCRKALEEAGGDMEKAIILLRKKGSEMAEKKSDRNASDGRIFIKGDGARSIALTLYCETDFVAQNQGFIDCGGAILEAAWNEGLDKAKDVAPGLINEAVLKTGENIQLGSIDEYSGEVVGSYIHFTGKNAVVLVLKGLPAQAGGDLQAVAKDIAMHISAMKPTYIKSDDINNSDIEAVIEVLRKEVDESGKPEDIKTKMMEGKVDAYFKELTLLDQSFFKNPEITIAKLLEQNKAEVVSFRLYTLG